MFGFLATQTPLSSFQCVCFSISSSLPPTIPFLSFSIVSFFANLPVSLFSCYLLYYTSGRNNKFFDRPSRNENSVVVHMGTLDLYIPILSLPHCLGLVGLSWFPSTSHCTTRVIDTYDTSQIQLLSAMCHTFLWHVWRSEGNFSEVWGTSVEGKFPQLQRSSLVLPPTQSAHPRQQSNIPSSIYPSWRRPLA